MTVWQQPRLKFDHPKEGPFSILLQISTNYQLPPRKICKNCGCPRGAHKIQRVIEEKKEVPRSILLSTADEDEDDYKELEVTKHLGFLCDHVSTWYM